MEKLTSEELVILAEALELFSVSAGYFMSYERGTEFYYKIRAIEEKLGIFDED